jgi:hypothetical protein
MSYCPKLEFNSMEDIKKKYKITIVTPHDQDCTDTILNLYNSGIVMTKLDFEKKHKKIMNSSHFGVFWSWSRYLCIVGKYYKAIKNYDLMKKYLLLSKRDKAYFELGYYYETIEKNYDDMMKYYSISIKSKKYKQYTIVRLKKYYDKFKKISSIELLNMLKFNIKNSYFNIKNLLNNEDFRNLIENNYDDVCNYKYFTSHEKNNMINIINLIRCL